MSKSNFLKSPSVNFAFDKSPLINFIFLNPKFFAVLIRCLIDLIDIAVSDFDSFTHFLLERLSTPTISDF